MDFWTLLDGIWIVFWVPLSVLECYFTVVDCFLGLFRFVFCCLLVVQIFGHSKVDHKIRQNMKLQTQNGQCRNIGFKTKTSKHPNGWVPAFASPALPPVWHCRKKNFFWNKKKSQCRTRSSAGAPIAVITYIWMVEKRPMAQATYLWNTIALSTGKTNPTQVPRILSGVQQKMWWEWGWKKYIALSELPGEKREESRDGAAKGWERCLRGEYRGQDGSKTANKRKEVLAWAEVGKRARVVWRRAKLAGQKKSTSNGGKNLRRSVRASACSIIKTIGVPRDEVTKYKQKKQGTLQFDCCSARTSQRKRLAHYQVKVVRLQLIGTCYLIWGLKIGISYIIHRALVSTSLGIA